MGWRSVLVLGWAVCVAASGYNLALWWIRPIGAEWILVLAAFGQVAIRFISVDRDGVVVVSKYSAPYYYSAVNFVFLLGRYLVEHAMEPKTWEQNTVVVLFGAAFVLFGVAGSVVQTERTWLVRREATDRRDALRTTPPRRFSC